MGPVDSTVGENSQIRESWPLSPVQVIRSRGFQLIDEQPIVRQPQPGEQFQGWDPLVSVTSVQPPTEGRHRTDRQTDILITTFHSTTVPFGGGGGKDRKVASSTFNSSFLLDTVRAVKWIIPPPPLGRGTKCYDEHVCLSVRSHNSCFHTVGQWARIKHVVMFRRSSPGGGTSWTSRQLRCVVEFIGNSEITSPQSNLRRARRKGPIGYNGTPQIHPQNCPFSFDDHHPHLITPILDRLHSPPQTASRSNQPFCTVHFPDRPTDRQTDGLGDRPVT